MKSVPSDSFERIPELTLEEFRFIRKQCGLSLKKLGQLLGFSKTTIWRWEEFYYQSSKIVPIWKVKMLIDAVGANMFLTAREKFEEIEQLKRKIREKNR